jgi:hypothetical protein
MTRIDPDLRAELQRGIAAAMDPLNRGAVHGGHAVTSLHSPWLHQPCPVCRHTFRVGDEVEIDRDTTVRHHSALLPCAGGELAARPKNSELNAFLAGLDHAWPPPPGVSVHRLEDGGQWQRLLAAPTAGFRRHSCAVCGHTLRPLDMVVICPCEPGQPRCQVAIHRDPVHGLNCWDAWSPGEFRLHCPATSRPIDAPR